MRRVALVLLVLWASTSFGQVSATLSGVVTDPSGASVNQAEITAKEVDTGLMRPTATDSAGRYEIFALPVGRYEIHAKKPG